MDSDLIVTLVYFLIIFLGIIFFVALYFISNRKEVEVRVLERINAQKAIETLVNNVGKQFKYIFSLPIYWRSFRRSTIVQILSWAMMLVLISSIIILIVGELSEDSLFQHNFMKQYIYYKEQSLAQIHDPRFIALANTNFNTFERNWANYMQIAVLGLEFLQLLSFPIQDIITSITSAQQEKAINGVDPGSIVSIASLLPNISVKFYLIQFWTCMGAILATALISLIIHFYNDRFIPGVSIFWVSHLVPVVHVAYLPVLVTFINSAACLLGNNDESSATTQLLKCEKQVIQPQLYLWLSLLGFTIAYFMMTVFVTSYERKPLEGDIEFKSKGVAFIKNMSLLLTIDFTLIPLQYPKLKGIFSVIILTAVVIYSIHYRPCYVSQINFWRTVGFSCILWAALPVAILDLGDLGTIPIVSLILAGWVLIFLLSLGGRYCAHANLTSTPAQIALTIPLEDDLNPSSGMLSPSTLESPTGRVPLRGGQSQLEMEQRNYPQRLSYTLRLKP